MKPLSNKYGQLFLYITLLVAVLILMFGTKRCVSSLPLDALSHGDSQGDTLDVALVYGPLSYYLYADTLGGINYDLLRLMEKDLKRPVKMWPVASVDEALSKLEKGTYDVYASIAADRALKERFLSTQSVFLDRMVLLQLADGEGNVRINSALDFNSDTIHVAKGSPAVVRLANLSKESDAQIVVLEEEDLSEEYLCMKVATGEIGMAVVNEATAKALHKVYPRLSFSNPVSFTQFQVWLLPKTSGEDLKVIDHWLDSVSHADTYEELMERYLK